MALQARDLWQEAPCLASPRAGAKLRAVELESGSHTEVECPAGPECLHLTRFLLVRQQEVEEAATLALAGQSRASLAQPCLLAPT